MTRYRVTATISAVLETLKYDLFDITPDFNGETDWSAVYAEIAAQGIRGFSEKTLNYILKNGILPQDEKHRLLADTWKQKINRQREIVGTVLEKQTQFVDLLRENGEKFVILKGFVSASLYHDYSCRRSGDVDFLVLPERFETVHRILVENGFTCIADSDPRHNEYTLCGVEFEMHKVFGFEDTPASKGKTVDERIYENLETPAMLTVDGHTFPSLSIENTGICFLVHFAHHLLTEGIGFRQYLDWVMFADRYLSDEGWNAGFGAVAEEMGLAALAGVMTKTAQLYFGLSAENRTWCSSVKERTCADLLHFMVEKGNYGVKNPDTDRFFSRIKNTDPEMNFLIALQKRGEINWKALEKHPNLRPFAWLYQLCRYTKKTIRAKNPLANFIRAHSEKKAFQRTIKACRLVSAAKK